MPDHPDHAKALDVAIIGAGPAGATAAAILLKYNPTLRVVMIEKEKFPRPHIGESQLPGISAILDEMGVWDKVEAADFPIKLGASYTWGRNQDVWDFDFYPVEQFKDEPRPARFEGQRRFTAFQVDREVYDTILAEHAVSLGARWRQETLVREVMVDADRISGLRLDSGEIVTARYYIDASGTAGILRRALNIDVTIPEELKNIAVWSYWDNAEWAVKIGVGGTRVQVRSLPYGWIWFIPMGPSKASVGLICPAEHYRRTGHKPEELYLRALAEQKEIATLLAKARQYRPIESTKDWSQVAARLVGDNWFVVGEAAGFADPILAAGMTLAHHSARDAAYTILELDRNQLPRKWLLSRFDEKNRHNIRQHIQFAQFWYASNGCFTDLQQHCSAIAKEAGLKLDPRRAWQWLAQGGFATETIDRPGFGSFDLGASKQIVEWISGSSAAFELDKYNVYKLNLTGAAKDALGNLEGGRIHRIECYRRGPKVLPVSGYYKIVIDALRASRDAKDIITAIQNSIMASAPDSEAWHHVSKVLQTIEAMIVDGWIQGSVDPRRPMPKLAKGGGRVIRANDEGNRAIAQRDQAPNPPDTPGAS
ncbi:MAG: tryptophan 7-halogenase [Phycisphaerales bacterium]|nr:tryptophan 7-halogenase [Phycisphaerales bacterium]